jgi:hypothetical protein
MTNTVFDGIAAVTASHVALGLAAGVLLGFVHFATLRRITWLYLGGNLPLALGLQMLRLALVGLVLLTLAYLGAGALLAGALGLLAVRHLFLRRA